MSENISKVKKNIKIFKRTMKILNKVSPGIIFIQLFYSISKAITPYIAIYMSAKIISELSLKTNERKVFEYVITTLVLTLISVILQAVLSFIINKNEVIIDSEFKNMLSQKSYNMPFNEVEKKEVHDLRKLVQMNSDTGVGGLKWTYLFLNSFLTQLSSIIIAIGISVDLLFTIPISIVTIILLIIIFFTCVICKAYINAIKESVMVNETRSSANIIFDYYHEKYLNDNNAAKDIRIFRHSNFVNQEINEKYCNPFNEGIAQRITANGKAQCINVGISTLLVSIIYIIISYFSYNDALPVGDLVKYTGTMSQMMNSFALITIYAYNLLTNNRSMELFFNYLDFKEEKQTGNLPIPQYNEGTAIEFRDVSFQYDDSTFGLKNISFTVNCGDKIAIVGRNGSGKSTLIKLICRLYYPSSGAIYLQGNNINEYDYYEYCKNLTSVFQDFSLFALSIGENISGTINYDEKEVWSALKKSGLEKRIQNMPKGLKQIIFKEFDKDGIDLSGGEKQKLAIARALFKDSKIIVLDEPTSALDPISEMETYKQLNQICKDKTIFFVSHRLNSCKFCDSIIVIKDGQISQIGTHDELIKDEFGEYFTLWNAQAKYYCK